MLDLIYSLDVMTRDRGNLIPIGAHSLAVDSCYQAGSGQSQSSTEEYSKTLKKDCDVGAGGQKGTGTNVVDFHQIRLYSDEVI